MKIRELLPDYVNDLLTPADRELVREHLEGCSACRLERDILSRTDRPVPEPPPVFWSSLPGRVTDSAGRAPGRVFHLPVPVWGGALAGAALLAFLLLGPGSVIFRGGEGSGEGPASGIFTISMGLEGDLENLPPDRIADLDRSLAEELRTPGDGDPGDPMEILFESIDLETMDEETLRIFEKILDQLSPEGVERG